jgi:phage terminase large subunit-like protein
MREIIERLREVEREQEKRKGADKLAGYNTGGKKHKKQVAFHKAKARNRWVFGGNRSGKTECGAVETVYMARGCHPYRKNRPNTSGWVVSLSAQVQRDVAQAKILRYLNSRWIKEIVMASGKKGSPEYGVIDYIEIENVFGGLSRIGFKSCDQGREKFQGTSLDYVWFDEEPPRDVYEECRMRVFDRRGDIFATMTPLKGLTWVYEDIYLKAGADIWCEFMEWADNPYLDKKEIRYMTEGMSPEQLDSRRYGRFGEGGGLVYCEFDPAVHIVEPFKVPREWYDTVSIDPGLNNPLSCHWYAVDFNGNVYVIAEHYEAGRDIDYHAAKMKEISARLSWPADGGGRIRALIDSAAGQRTLAAVKSVSELFYDYGILVNAKVDKDVFSGIARVKSYLRNAAGQTRLYIFKTCPNMIREIKGYFWGEGDAPRKRDDHAMDDLRYYIMSRPETPKITEKLTLVQKDKMRRIRKLKR